VTRPLATARGVLAALLLAGMPAVALAAPIVKDVRVEGTRRADPAAVLSRLGTKVGAPLDLEQLDKDIRAVMGLGAFAEVVVEQEGAADAPVVVYRVVERPTIHEAKIVGNKTLSKDDLKDTVELKPLAYFDPAAVAKDVRAIQKKYVEKGYFLAETTSRVVDQPDNQVDVLYEVNEHAKVQVKELRLIGNDQVPKDDITGYLQTKEGDFLSLLGLGAGATLREDALKGDLDAVQAVYLEKGYVEIKVGKPSVQLSPDRRQIFISIPVEEGPQYDLGKVEFTGTLLGQDDRLKELLTLRTGDRFVRSKVWEDLQAAQDLYKDMGYAYANVSLEPVPHPDTKRVDLNLNVQPGHLVKFRRIEMQGNSRTRDKVIRRELRIYEGELFSGTGMKQSKNRITALGFFEGVELTPRRVIDPTSGKPVDDQLDVVVEVKERPTGSFQLGAGYSSYESFVLTGQISQNNFFGWGQTLSLEAQWSTVRQLGQISFVEPYFLDTQWTFAFDLYAQEQQYQTFTRRAVGGTMTWGYELSGLQRWWAAAKNLEDVRLSTTYTNERLNISAATDPLPHADADGSGTTSSLRFSLSADKRDNRLFPTRGWFGSVSLETAPQLLAPRALFGRQVNLFNRYALDLRAFHPIWKGIIARSRFEAGLIRSLSDRRVPVAERYFLGGMQSIRGYAYQSVGPTRARPCSWPLARTCESPEGGLQQLLVNLEAEFPLAAKAGVRAVLFFDAGNTYHAGTWRDPAVSLGLYKSWGFGLRWTSPLGPLRFEWGFPLDRRKSTDPGVGYIDPRMDFQFTVGNFF
jgi:outer membrane protein insertion porin family